MLVCCGSTSCVVFLAGAKDSIDDWLQCGLWCQETNGVKNYISVISVSICIYTKRRMIVCTALN